MIEESVLTGIILGAIQGILEWLPVSSEGNITVILTALGRSPATAVSLALFLHLGTAVSASVYYRRELWAVFGDAWKTRTTLESTTPVVFYLIATVTSGVVGIAAYASLVEFVTALTGSAIVICIGVLLIAMGVFQAVTSTVSSNKTREPTVGDAVLVGIAQGVAILPGVTRSGMTTGTLLLRGHDGPAAFRYSFILSIPAALGGGLLGGLETGISDFAFSVALAAFVTAALVGLVSIEFLIRIVERVAFSVVCLLLGTATVLGGVVVL